MQQEIIQYSAMNVVSFSIEEMFPCVHAEEYFGVLNKLLCKSIVIKIILTASSFYMIYL